MVVDLSPVAVTQTSDSAPALSKELLDIQTTIEYGFTLKCIHDKMHPGADCYFQVCQEKTSLKLGGFYWAISKVYQRKHMCKHK